MKPSSLSCSTQGSGTAGTQGPGSDSTYSVSNAKRAPTPSKRKPRQQQQRPTKSYSKPKQSYAPKKNYSPKKGRGPKVPFLDEWCQFRSHSDVLALCLFPVVPNL